MIKRVKEHILKDVHVCLIPKIFDQNVFKNGTFTSSYNSINRKINNYKKMVFKCFVARLQNTLLSNRQYKK